MEEDLKPSTFRDHERCNRESKDINITKTDGNVFYIYSMFVIFKALDYFISLFTF